MDSELAGKNEIASYNPDQQYARLIVGKDKQGQTTHRITFEKKGGLGTYLRRRLWPWHKQYNLIEIFKHLESFPESTTQLKEKFRQHMFSIPIESKIYRYKDLFSYLHPEGQQRETASPLPQPPPVSSYQPPPVESDEEKQKGESAIAHLKTCSEKVLSDLWKRLNSKNVRIVPAWNVEPAKLYSPTVFTTEYKQLVEQWYTRRIKPDEALLNIDTMDTVLFIDWEYKWKIENPSFQPLLLDIAWLQTDDTRRQQICTLFDKRIEKIQQNQAFLQKKIQEKETRKEMRESDDISRSLKSECLDKSKLTKPWNEPSSTFYPLIEQATKEQLESLQKELQETLDVLKKNRQKVADKQVPEEFEL